MEKSNRNHSNVNIKALLGYHIYYRELSEEQYQKKEISKYEGTDTCGGSTWNILFEENQAKFSIFDQFMNANKTETGLQQNKSSLIEKYSLVVTYIPNCKPYTPYAIYVTTVMEKQLTRNATGAQSDIAYARTNESNPSPVINVKAESPSPHSMELSWSKPVKPHGVIKQYYIEITYLQTRKDIEERDYCVHKKDHPKSPKEEPESVTPLNMGSCTKCESCETNEGSNIFEKTPNSNKVVG